MFLFKLYMGAKNTLALLSKRRGRLYVTSDTGELYADVSSTVRRPIGYSRADIDFKFDSQKDYIDNAVANIDAEYTLKGEFTGEFEGDSVFNWRLMVDANTGTATIAINTEY